MTDIDMTIPAWRNLQLRNDQRELLIACLEYCHQANITDRTAGSLQDLTIARLIDALSIAMTVRLER